LVELETSESDPATGYLGLDLVTEKPIMLDELSKCPSEYERDQLLLNVFR
jgi:hypothetical protein